MRYIHESDADGVYREPGIFPEKGKVAVFLLSERLLLFVLRSHEVYPGEK